MPVVTEDNSSTSKADPGSQIRIEDLSGTFEQKKAAVAKSVFSILQSTVFTRLSAPYLGNFS